MGVKKLNYRALPYADKVDLLQAFITSQGVLTLSDDETFNISDYETLQRISFTTIKADTRVSSYINAQVQKLIPKHNFLNFVAHGFLYEVCAGYVYKRLSGRQGNALNVLTRLQFRVLMFAFIYDRINRDFHKGVFCRTDVLTGNVREARKYMRAEYLTELERLGYIDRVLDVPAELRARDFKTKRKPYYYRISATGRKSLKLFFDGYREIVKELKMDIFTPFDKNF